MLGRKILFLMLSTVFKSIIFFITGLFVARILGPERFGAIAFLQAVVATMLIANDLSFGRTHVKRLSEGENFGDCLRTYFLLKAFTLALTLLFFVIFLGLYWKGYHTIIPHDLLPIFFVLFSASLINQTLNYFFIMTFDAFQLVVITETIDLIGLLGFSIYSIASLLLWNDLYIYSFGFLIKEGILFIFLIYFFGRHFASNIKSLLNSKKLILKNYWSYTLPQMTLIPLSILYTQIDKIAIRYLSSFQQVGFYAVAQRLSVLSLFQKIFMKLFFPELSRDYGLKDHEVIKQKMGFAEHYLSLIFFTLALPLFFFSKEFIYYTVGADYIAADFLLKGFILVMLFTILENPYISLLYATEKNKLHVILSFTGVGFFVILAILFVPENFFGLPGLGLMALGIVMAQLIKEFIFFLVYKYIAWFFFKIKYSVNFIRYLFIYGVIFLVDQAQLLGDSLGVRLGGYLVIYALLAKLLKLYSLKDIRYLNSVINPRKLLSYIKGEMVYDETSK